MASARDGWKVGKAGERRSVGEWTGNDQCAAWTPDGKIFLFDSDRAGGFGSKDLLWVSFKDVLGHPLAADSTLR